MARAEIGNTGNDRSYTVRIKEVAREDMRCHGCPFERQCDKRPGGGMVTIMFNGDPTRDTVGTVTQKANCM